MPPGTAILNVNFPMNVDTKTEIALTEIGRRKYTDKVLVRKDPKGRAYYWLFGERLSHFPPKSDAEAVLMQKKVSISPMLLNVSGPVTEALEQLRERVSGKLGQKEGARLRNK